MMGITFFRLHVLEFLFLALDYVVGLNLRIELEAFNRIKEAIFGWKNRISFLHFLIKMYKVG